MPYGVDYGHGKERQRMTFKTKKEKDDWKRGFIDKWQSDRDSLLSFDHHEWREYLSMKSKLDGRGSMTDAVDFYLLHHTGSPVPLFSEVVKRRLEDLDRINGAQRAHAELYLNRFQDAMEDRKVTEYTRGDIQRWVDSLVAKGNARATVVGHLGQVRTAFNLCFSEGVIQRSPVINIKLPTTRMDKRLSLVAPKELQRLLKEAWEHDRPMAGLLALAFFTGLRMSVLAPPPRKLKNNEYLTFDMIDRKHMTIVIPAHVMKMNTAHIIDQAPECLWTWLGEIKKKDFGIRQNEFNERKQALCAMAKMKWTPNLHRRSAASYMAAVYGKERSADILADRSMRTFEAHYRVPSFVKVAKTYFKIVNET
jgi:site-specific recombinase XerD